MDSNPARILIVEDDAAIRRFVRQALEAEGHQVFETDSVKRGLIEAGTRKPDLLILDLGLPDGDGVELIRDLRGWSTLPVVVLSARVDETDKIEALDAGADDYLTKPFSLSELLARVRVANRHLAQRALDGGDKAECVFTAGDLRIDLAKREVVARGQEVRLTPIEYKLLTTLVRNAGRVMTYQQLLKEVWGPRFASQKQYLHVYMGHLRNKLELDPARPQLLRTEPGVGYRLKAE